MKHGRSFSILVLATGIGLLCEAPSWAQTNLLHDDAMLRMVGLSSKNMQGYLGVDLRDVSDEQAVVLKLKEARGAEITGVDHDAPACKAGLQLHDVILQMNGQAIDDEEQLRRMLRETPAGRQVTFVISRDGQQRTIQTQLANREEVERQAWEKHYTVPDPSGSSSASTPRVGNSFLSPSKSGSTKGTRAFLGTTMLVSSSFTGAKLEVMGPQLADFFGAQGSAGLLVRSVEPNSPAADAGMKAGDVVVKVNSVEIASGNDWSKTIHENKGRSVTVVVLRDKKQQTLTLIPDAKKRSAVEPWANIEGFFGNSPQAQDTRATLAELEPVMTAMAAKMRHSLEEVGDTPEMNQMMAKLDAWSSNPEFQRQMAVARRQVSAAAEQMRLDSPALRDRMNALHEHVRDMTRLD
ncbi:PDZ domain-containing protein [Edaphobacter modestus]|uniref:PDZ domain-containing protein n=1 Tax=Edaphobacter modestus TaxID=388466 RepID=A0A4Q7YUZ7_9BACT|nr:PDZ domain-containing protein [Edaphobacter modestus]RZU41470.1 PDZ domain-containing protein [Edaphobacter modestus]